MRSAAQLRDWSAVIAEALGIDTCRIGGVGRRITITPVLLPLSVAAQAA